jgi:hypothetical protein
VVDLKLPTALAREKPVKISSVKATTSPAATPARPRLDWIAASIGPTLVSAEPRFATIRKNAKML